jgi:hypothetical protein
VRAAVAVDHDVLKEDGVKIWRITARFFRHIWRGRVRTNVSVEDREVDIIDEVE